MSDRYVLVDGDGSVVNAVLWDGKEGWSPPEGQTPIASDEAGPGWTYAGGKFAAPAIVDAPIPVPASTVVDGVVFLTRLTDAEYTAVMAAAAQNVQLARWVDQFRLLGHIDVASAAAVAAKAALVAAGLFTADRATEVFAPPA
jgi:hypothetical protein